VRASGTVRDSAAGVYFRLGRVSNLPTVWTNVLAGTALAGVHVAPGRLAALMLAFSLLYVGGMYLNDAFDRDIDARERPERPIPSGRIGAGRVFAIGFSLLGLGVLLQVPVGAWPAWVSGAVLAGVITYYDIDHKTNRLSPLVMALCRVLVYVTAALAVADRLPRAVVGGAAVLLCYLVGLTCVAKQENLSEVRNLWPLAFLAAPFLYTAPAIRDGVLPAALYVAFLAWVAYMVSLVVRREGRDIRGAVVGLIAAISLLDALLIAGTADAGRAAAAIAGFALTLGLQRWVPGT
jgi:4-hydroxybenzoate polyprenyltransferase